MKVFLAGSTGAIGRPLAAALAASGHQVTGTTRSERGRVFLTGLGVTPVILDALNAEAVQAAIKRSSPDVVIDQLTALPTRYRRDELLIAFEPNRRLRIEGGANLLKAAEAAGVQRYIVQSGGFLAAPGVGLADESTPFAVDGPPGVAANARMYEEIERRATQSASLDAVILRYGIFYGPGTWFNRDGDIVDQLRSRMFPIVGAGEGVWSFIHVEDAASATVASINGAPGVYNIADDQPIALRDWLPAFADSVGAPRPGTITEADALQAAGPEFVYYAMRLRGASNAKARGKLDFQPRRLPWLDAARTAGTRSDE